MRIGSLFSGYGGLDLAVQSVLGGDIAWHVEYDKAPSRILDHHFPGVPNYGDVTQLDFTTVEPVDVLTGGYPCQPFSHAGLRKGTDDDRHLWPHVLRAIREMGPRLAILENVRGHLSLGFGTVLSDLASVGWSCRWGVVRASDAGAPHQRARLFIVAYPSHLGLQWGWRSRLGWAGPTDSRNHDSDVKGAGRVRAPQHENDGADTGRGRRYDAADLGQGSSANAADATGNGRPQRWTGSSERAGSSGQPAGDLSPTTAADLAGGQARRDTGHDSKRLWVKPLGLAQPPTDANLAGSQGSQSAGRHDVSAWGDYGPAIARWERVIGRPAPPPTEPGRTGAPRLSPRFVEWMMGLDDGWVTDPAIGISRNDQLKALGNGVVPQQAALALGALLGQTVAA